MRAFLARIALLAFSIATAASQNTRVYMYNGASTYSGNGGRNYEAGARYQIKFCNGEPGCTDEYKTYNLVYTQGTGSMPRWVSYGVFDFSTLAPISSRFCATGAPKLFLSQSSTSATPSMATTVTTDALTNVNYGALTWNNQPALSSYIARVSQSGYTKASEWWYYVDLPATLLNTVVRNSASTVTLRQQYDHGTQIGWETHKGSAPFRAYIALDYLTCDQNAGCSYNGECTCNTHYAGSGTQCTYSSCDTTIIGNANFTLTLTGVTSTGTCLPGYIGYPKALCSNTVWGAVRDPCIPLTCSEDITGSVGNAGYPITNAGQVAVGSCITGYNGTATRFCSPYGTWADTAIESCSRLVCPAVTMGNAEFIKTYSTVTRTGACLPGYATSSGTPASTCSASGAWGNVTRPCTRIECQPFADAVNNVQWPKTITMTNGVGLCVAGFQGSPQRPCEANGSWNTTVIGTCHPISCSAESSFKNAAWPATNAGSSSNGTCVTGYSGAPVRMCSITGVWASSVSPACVRNTCWATTFENANWPGNTLSMTTATGTCVTGYSGVPSRACSADGTWSPSIANPCVRLYCPWAQRNDAIWPHSAAPTSTVSGECIAGYSGTPTRDCSVSGEWLAVSGACTRYSCSSTTEGFASWPSTDSLTSVSATCFTGYQGSPSRTCGPDGIFGEIINPCRPIVCSAHNQGSAQWSDTISGTTAYGVCNLGWTGSPMRECSISGTWGSIVSPCTRIKCAAINDASAQARFPETNAGDSNVDGTCYDNTFGFPARDCFYDGTWSEARNPCSTNPCPALRNNGHADWESPSTVNQVVTGTCVAGYDTTLPPPQRMCKDNGQWDTVITNPCKPIYCTKTSPSYSPFNAEWPESVQAGSSASGTCLAGFSGTTARVCTLAGDWGTPSPACQAIRCAAIGDDGAHSSWPQTQAGHSASGACLAGYGGAPTRLCSSSGIWETVSAPCTQLKCPSGMSSDSMWVDTPSGLSSTGTCVPGTVGSVTRSCSLDGVWGPVVGKCNFVICPAETMSNAQWIDTLAGNVAYGDCVIGYASSPAPSRSCLENGIWGSISGTCKRLVCPSETFENALWPPENSMTNDVRGTCTLGWYGAPLRDCSASGLYSAVRNPCLRIMCPALDSEAGAWGPTNAGTTSVGGICPLGTIGLPVRDCALNGTWTSILSDNCIPLSCPAQSYGHVIWPATSADSAASGSCPTGYSGSPARACSSSGVWGPIVNPCLQNVCPAVMDGHVEWPNTLSLSAPVYGECETGYFGSPSRQCQNDGNWGAISNPCASRLCSAERKGNADWFATTVGAETVGLCISGYQGTPRRQCLTSGNWSTVISDPCTVKYDDCQSSTVGMTFFPPASPGASVEGICATGYEFAPEGPPMRYCYSNGTWEDTYARPCIFTPVVGGQLENFRWTSKTSDSVSLAWDTANATESTRFLVEVATLTGSFVVANSGAASNIPERHVVVGGLISNSGYQFRVSISDNGYSDIGAVVLQTKTYIPPASSFQLEAGTHNSLRVSWTASPEGAYYELWYRKLAATRAVSDGFTLFSQLGSASTDATVTGLETSKAYELLLLAGRDGETEQVGVRLTASTSSADYVGDGDGGVREDVPPIGLIVGVVLGVIFLILMLVGLKLYIRRRNRVADISKVDYVESTMALHTPDDGSDDPESENDGGDAGGLLGASSQSSAALAPHAFWGPSDVPGEPAQEEQDLPPAYFSIAHDQASSSVAGKHGLGGRLGGEKRVNEKPLAYEKKRTASRKGTDECSSSSALLAGPVASPWATDNGLAAPAVSPWASQTQPPVYFSSPVQPFLADSGASSSGEGRSSSTRSNHA